MGHTSSWICCGNSLVQKIDSNLISVSTPENQTPKKMEQKKIPRGLGIDCGDNRIRTDDLLHAMQAL